MEGKEIIENMSKGTVYTPQNDDKSTTNMKRVWIKTKSGNWAFVTAYGLTGNESFANSELICEAFNVANQTGLTPSQLQSELEKAKELISKKDIEIAMLEKAIRELKGDTRKNDKGSF